MKSPLLPVEEALTRLFSLAQPLGTQTIPLEEAYGRRLAKAVIARRNQPSFDASAMDGYAIADPSPAPGKRYRVIGQAAAGQGYDSAIANDEAVRIFTGAPVPQGASFVVIQEDTEREADTITLREGLETSRNIRFKGGDFTEGTPFFPQQPLGAADLGLIAAMNVPEVEVLRRARVAILPTGNELVPLGQAPGAAQIINSNVFSLAALAREAGADVRVLPIAGDDEALIAAAIESAAEADILVTIGGASVGELDLLAPTARAVGFDLAFHKVALRPGKPLLVGKRNAQVLLGLPGNAVSSFVCATLFLKPLIMRLNGSNITHAPYRLLPLAVDLGANGPRDHYQRARLIEGKVQPFERQDSSLQHVLAEADGLLLQPKNNGGLSAGDLVQFYPLRPLDI